VDQELPAGEPVDVIVLLSAAPASVRRSVSFIAMREAGVTQALTFDQPFVQAGFQALMREIPRT